MDLQSQATVPARLPRLIRAVLVGVAVSVLLSLPARSGQAQERELLVADGYGPVNWPKSHVSLSRTLPADLGGDPLEDREALRWGVRSLADRLPRRLTLQSFRPDGSMLDELEVSELHASPCPSTPGAGEKSGKFVCAFSDAIRAVVDPLERMHPAALGRAIHAEVGGRLEVSSGAQVLGGMPVGGPRRSAWGGLGRQFVKLRVRVVRSAPGGKPAVGGSTVGAVMLMRNEVRAASALWGQCGIHLGLNPDVQVVDPPEPHRLVLGCQGGRPASGGVLAFRAGSQPVQLRTGAGQTPTQVAWSLVKQLQRAGLRAWISGNAPVGPGSLRSVDVLVESSRGTPVALSLDPDRPPSTDQTLPLCLGPLNFATGLEHFTDYDSSAGTVEERSLISAFDDGDPSTIEVLVIPRFSGSGRIGESFIRADGSGLRNAIILDRTAIESRNRSFALAHELGHILLDVPGHPDDYGVDTSSDLMDADASDDTIFGPRRLSLKNCERVVRQSGPLAPIPLLRPWPFRDGTREPSVTASPALQRGESPEPQ